jgi:hypothetical protein
MFGRFLFYVTYEYFKHEGRRYLLGRLALLDRLVSCCRCRVTFVLSVSDLTRGALPVLCYVWVRSNKVWNYAEYKTALKTKTLSGLFVEELFKNSLLLPTLELKQTSDFYIIIKYIACIGELAPQFNKEVAINFLGMEFLNKVTRRFHRSPCG